MTGAHAKAARVGRQHKKSKAGMKAKLKKMGVGHLHKYAGAVASGKHSSKKGKPMKAKGIKKKKPASTKKVASKRGAFLQ